MPPRLTPQNTICRWAKTQRYLSAPQLQHLSTSTRSLAAIPPESPKYIDVPQSLQPDAIKLRQVKGVLPVPRKVFPHIPSSKDTDKTSPTYLLAVTPEPQPKGLLPPFTDPTTAAFISWKERQAAARRRNLREGLIELEHRKQVSDGHRNRRAKRRIEERERLVSMPMREDERLTGPTIIQSQLPARLRKGGKPQMLPYPNRTQRIISARERTARHEEERRGERRDDLHTLYMNANTFITTEEELNAVVENVFDDTEQFTTLTNAGENVWNLGYQTTVAEMLDEANQGEKAVDNGRKKQMVEERYLRMAEVLTGGKM